MLKLNVVIPCYNEQEVLYETSRRLHKKMRQLMSDSKISRDSKVVFVDDGSKDMTWSIIEQLHEENSLFGGVKLSRNRGHQNALLAGLASMADHGDAVISMDADLQDDIEAIDDFIEQYNNGCEVVYGVRKARQTDTFFKRFTAEQFYKMMHLLGAEVVYNHADYRLLSNRALKGLLEFKEVNLFLRGIVPMVGYKSGRVYYDRNERFAGESKYPLKKMLSFAFQGITSLSIKPIRFIINLGLTTFFISIIMMIYFLVQHFTGNTVSGWTSLIVSIWALGGLQLLAIGIIGEYIGKVYLETKERPRFIIEKKLYDVNKVEE
ncbi:glycosyltransferase [Lachnospiraceae bacterium KM106-2]|nr:glycosyltransferase [Lachnospiraceae bacterium KM106-2]